MKKIKYILFSVALVLCKGCVHPEDTEERPQVIVEPPSLFPSEQGGLG